MKKPFRPLALTTVLIVVFSLLSVGCGAQRGRSPIHEDFDLTESELEELVSTLPEDARSVIMEHSERFLDLSGDILRAPLRMTVLVDKSHPLPAAYAPEDIVSLNDYDVTVSRRDLRLSESVMPDLLEMVAAARSDDIELVFSSAYRSYEYQAGVYARNVRQYGQEQADRESAQPGKSQHQLGTTVDFGSIDDSFAETPSGRWLVEHAWEYGFSLSYPAGQEELTGYRHEIWHYRYITKAGTALEREFFDGVQQNMLAFLHGAREALRESMTEAAS